MLWPVGKLYVGSQQRWTEFTTLLKAGIAGVHDAVPHNGPAIMIHIDRGGDPGGAQWFYDHMRDYAVPYDIIGLSYYPYWHGTLSNVRTNLDNLAARYGKPVMIVETAYPWTLDDHDNYPNIIGPSTYLPPEYPPTPEGQALFVRDLLSMVARTPNNLGRGVVYWEPAWIPGVGWAPGQGDAWDNQTFFDPTGQALPSVDAMQVAPHSNSRGPALPGQPSE
jgi:arabinogalactan endo-1,4-beta-galactosidase